MQGLVRFSRHIYHIFLPTVCNNIMTICCFCPALTELTLDLHVNFCMCSRCCTDSVRTVFFSTHLIGWYTGVWEWFWHPTYPNRCFDLGWAVPHSHFFTLLSSTHEFFKWLRNETSVLIQDLVTSYAKAWLSNAAFKFFSLDEQCHTHIFLTWLKNENNPTNEDKLKNSPDL